MKPRFPIFPGATPAPSGSPGGPAAAPSPPVYDVPRISRRHGQCFAALLAVYVAASLWHLGRPGLHYDEAYPASLALKMHSPRSPLDLNYGKHFFVGRRFFVVQPDPLHGASRAWLTFLWFLLVPPGMAGLRTLGILLGGMALFLTFRLATRWFGPPTGLAASALLAADPVYVFLVRNDIHFNSLDLCFRLVCVLLVARLWDGASWRREGSLLALSVLAGLWTCAEFLWFVGGLVTAVTVVGHARWRPTVAANKWLGWLLVPLILWILFFLYVTRTSPEPLVPDLLRRLADVVVRFRVDEALKRFRLVGNTFNGNWLETFYLGSALPRTWHPFWEIFSPAAALFLLAPVRPWAIDKDGRQSRKFFLLCLGFFSLVLLMLSPPVYAAHHVWTVYPFLHMFTAAVLAELWRRSLRLRALCLLLAVYYVLGAGRTLMAMHGRFERGAVHPHWSPVIQEVADELLLRGRPAVCLDWGFSHNLAVLTGGRVPLAEPSYDRAEGFLREDLRPLWGDWFADSGRLYLLHAPGSSVYSRGREDFFALVRAFGREARLRRIFLHREKPFVEVYDVEPRSL